MARLLEYTSDQIKEGRLEVGVENAKCTRIMPEAMDPERLELGFGIRSRLNKFACECAKKNNHEM